MPKNITSTTNKNTKKKESGVKLSDTSVAAIENLLKNKNTKSKEPVASVKFNKKKGELTVNMTSSTPAPTTTFSLNDNKKVGSGANQAGKKRGNYSNNLWVIESSDDGKKWNPDEIVFASRDSAREKANSYRYIYPDERFRVAKYVFTAVDKS